MRKRHRLEYRLHLEVSQHKAHHLRWGRMPADVVLYILEILSKFSYSYIYIYIKRQITHYKP